MGMSEGRIIGYATDDSPAKVLAYYSSEFAKLGFRDRREYTGIKDHLKGFYRKGNHLAWVDLQISLGVVIWN